MTIGKHNLNTKPVWYLGNNVSIENVESLDILGVSFDTNGTSSIHINNIISKCRKSFFGLSDAGMSYPGADASIKKHLWTTICRPTLLYGMECVELSKTTLSRLETVQGNHLKQSLGLSKTARTSYLLDSLNIPRIQSVLSKKCATFYHSIFKCDTPAAELDCSVARNRICIPLTPKIPRF